MCAQASEIFFLWGMGRDDDLESAASRCCCICGSDCCCKHVLPATLSLLLHCYFYSRSAAPWQPPFKKPPSCLLSGILNKTSFFVIVASA